MYFWIILKKTIYEFKATWASPRAVSDASGNLCPFKHCCMENALRATGTFSPPLQQDRHAEIEKPNNGGIAARIPGQDIEGLGTLCSLSALINMLLRGDAEKILLPGDEEGGRRVI